MSKIPTYKETIIKNADLKTKNYNEINIKINQIFC